VTRFISRISEPGVARSGYYEVVDDSSAQVGGRGKIQRFNGAGSKVNSKERSFWLSMNIHIHYERI